MSTKGDMVDFDTIRQRLAIGSANQILQVKSNLPSWETVDLADTVLTTAGDVLYENATPELARLPKGTDADVLTLASGLPSWSAPAGGGVWSQKGITELTEAGESILVDGMSLDLTPASGDYTTVKAVIDTVSRIPRQVDAKINAQTDYGGNVVRCNSGSFTGIAFSNTTTIPLSKDVSPSSAPAGEINIYAGESAGGATLKYLWGIAFDLDFCLGGGDMEGTHSTTFTGIEFIASSGNDWGIGSTATVYALSRTE
jgi:hypothetical protein